MTTDRGQTRSGQLASSSSPSATLVRPRGAADAAWDPLQHVRALARQSERTLLGIAGPPGAGKSTLAHALARHVGDAARVVGMDGFHLSQTQLRALGREGRKGAIDTFDAWGFVALVKRLRATEEDVIYAPEFRRDLEEPIAGAVPIAPQVRLVVIEGNYLLVERAPWGGLRDLLDEVWYCERDEQSRLAALILRHESYGKSENEAREWALGPDQRNAEVVLGTRSRADRIVAFDDRSPRGDGPGP